MSTTRHVVLHGGFIPQSRAEPGMPVLIPVSKGLWHSWHVLTVWWFNGQEEHKLVIVTHRARWMGKGMCLEYNVSRGVREERPSLGFVIVTLPCTPTFLLRLVVCCASLCRNVRQQFLSDFLTDYTKHFLVFQHVSHTFTFIHLCQFSVLVTLSFKVFSSLNRPYTWSFGICQQCL